MSTYLSLKKISIADLLPLQVISRATFFETFGPDNTEADMEKYATEAFSSAQLTSELEDPNSEFYLAQLDDKIVGYLKLNTAAAQTVIQDDNALEIERIYVLQAFQGQKIGQTLFDKAIAIGQQKQMHYIWLGVWEHNHSAIQFYHKNGFVAFDQHIFQLGEDAQTDIMMKREL